MEIPPNILKELEEKKAKAILANTATEAPPERPLPPLIPLYTPLQKGDEMGGMGIMGEMRERGETGKPSSGEIFFGYLSKIAVLAAVFLTPLFFFTSSDTINLPKQLLLSVLALTALSAWVGQSVAAGKVTWWKTDLQWPILGVVLVAVFSSVFSSGFWVSFLGDSGRYSSAGLSVLAYIILAVVASQMGETLRHGSGQALQPSSGQVGETHSTSSGRVGGRDLTVAAWLGSVFLVSVFALFQFFGLHIFSGEAYQTRIFNPIGSPFGLGLFILSSVPFLLVALQSPRQTRDGRVQGASKKVLLAAALVVQLVAAAIIDFRVGWIALAVAVLVLIVKGLMGETHSISSGRVGKMGLPLGAIVLAALLWFMPALQIKDLNFPAEINPSYRASFDILAQAWREKPIFGSGLETYPYIYAKFKSAALNQTNYWGVNFNDATADFVTWATTTGIFGAVMWLIFAAGVIRKGMTPLRPSFAGQGGGMGLGIFASWMFILVTKFFYPTPLALEFMFWFLPALLVLAQKNADGTQNYAEDSASFGVSSASFSYRFQQGSAKTLAMFFVLLVVLLGALVGGYFSIRRWGAERTFVKTVTMSNGATVEDDADPSKPVGASNRDEVLNGIYAAIAADPYEVRYFRVLSQALFQKMNDVVAGINTRPEAERRAKPEETALLQNLTVRTVNAVQRAGALDPQNVGVAVDAAESYRDLVALVQGADDLAIQNYERASDLEPINPFIKTQLGQLYLIKSNLFNQGLTVDTDMVDKARAILEKTLELNPNYANARYFSALIYDKDGKKDMALQNFLFLRQTNPDNKLIAAIVANLQNGYPALGNPPQPATPPQSPKAKETKGEPR